MLAILRLMFLPLGRANRLAFLAGIGAYFLAMPVITQLYNFTTRAFAGKSTTTIMITTSVPFTLALTAWVLFCLFANRLHDIGRSALWAIVPALLPTLVMGAFDGYSARSTGWGMILTMFAGPVLYFAFTVLLLFFKGSDAPNRFGERPVIA